MRVHSMSFRRAAGVVACSLSCFTAASLAHADEKNPAVEACAGKQEGDACMLPTLEKSEGEDAERKTVPGVCRPDECCDLDYSQGSPPKTTCGPCLACKGGPADGGAEDGSNEAVADEPPRIGDEPPASSPAQGKRGCQIGAGSSSLSLLGLLLVGGLVRRRRIRLGMPSHRDAPIG